MTPNEKDIEMARESAIDGTEILPEEIHKSDKSGGKRNLRTGGRIEEMRTASHMEEMMIDGTMIGKDTGKGEKTTTTVMGEIEADLLGVVKINS